MYQDTIYICISWYSKICWFPVKNVDVSKTEGVCHVIYISFGSSLGRVKVPSFIIVGYEWDILGREGVFAPLLPPKRPTLNWVKAVTDRFLKIYGKFSLKRATVNAWEEKFKKKDFLSLDRKKANQILWMMFQKIRDVIIGSRLAGSVILTGIIKANSGRFWKNLVEVLNWLKIGLEKF